MKRTRLFADAIALPLLLLLAAAQVLTYAIDPGTLVENLIAGLTFVVGFGSAGWLVGRRVPVNPIGWCFAFAAFTSVAHGWAHLGPEHRAAPGLLVWVSALRDTFSRTIAVPLKLLVPLLLMPDGWLPSRHWRQLLYAELTGCASVVGFITLPGTIAGAAAIVRPFQRSHDIEPLLAAATATMGSLAASCSPAPATAARKRRLDPKCAYGAWWLTPGPARSAAGQARPPGCRQGREERRGRAACRACPVPRFPGHRCTRRGKTTGPDSLNHGKVRKSDT